MARAKEDLTGFVRLYSTASWIIFRLYGILFGWITWIAYNWHVANSLEGKNLFYGYPAEIGLYLTGTICVLLTVPFFTPKFISQPKSVLSGFFAAVLLMVLSFIIYTLLQKVLFFLGIFSQNKEVLDSLLLFFKALASTMVCASILVGFAAQINKSMQNYKFPLEPKRKKRWSFLRKPHDEAAMDVKTLIQHRQSRIKNQ